MNTIKIFNLAFSLHRYIGLAVELILIVVGLTSSLFVFSGKVLIKEVRSLFFVSS